VVCLWGAAFENVLNRLKLTSPRKTILTKRRLVGPCVAVACGIALHHASRNHELSVKETDPNKTKNHHSLLRGAQKNQPRHTRRALGAIATHNSETQKYLILKSSRCTRERKHKGSCQGRAHRAVFRAPPELPRKNKTG